MANKFFIQVPSTISWEEKLMIAKEIHSLGFFGASISALPSNHDIFQVLTVFGTKFSKLNLGAVIVPPLLYPHSHLLKAFRTILDILTVDRLVFGLGLGDRFSLKRLFPGVKNYFQEFKKSVITLLEGLEKAGYQPNILLAGSGNKMIEFAKEYKLGILYNGIPPDSLFERLDNIDVFIMSHFGDLLSMPKNHLSVLLKMIAALPKSELERLGIDYNLVSKIKVVIKEKQFDTIRNSNYLSLFNKISFVGQPQKFFDLIENLRSKGVERIFISQSPIEQLSEIIKHGSS